MQPTIHIQPTGTLLENFDPALLDAVDQATAYVDRTAAQLGDARPFISDLDDAREVWDGWVRFLNRGGSGHPRLPLGLRHIAYNVARAHGVEPLVHDWRRPPEPYREFLERYPNPIPLWDHQEVCARAMLQSLDGVAEMPPRAGKTRTLLEVIRRLAVPFHWVAPTTSIVDQTVRAAREFFEDYDAVHVTSKTQDDCRGALLTVSTAGAVRTLGPAFWKSRHGLACDEAHHYLGHRGWGESLIKKAPHIVYRKGMTGTFFRSSGDDLAMHAFLSRSLFSITSKELEERGYLVPCYSVFVPITGPKVRRPRGHPNTFNGPGGHGTLGLAKHGHRNDVVASAAKHLSNLGRTVLILVWTKQQGYEVLNRLEPMFPGASPSQRVKPVEFVSTDRPKLKIREILDSFRGGGNCRVLVGTSMVSEGTDLPPADALVYAAGGKASVSLTQSWYRVITKTDEKQYAVIVDFYDMHHRKLWEHSHQRWGIMQGDAIFRMSYAPDLHHFERWCANLAPWSAGCGET